MADSAQNPAAQASAAQAPSSGDIASLSYEQARDELVRVVGELEQGSTTLEESLALWERGEALARRCEEWLLGAKERLDAARNAATGAATNAANGAAAGRAATES